MGGELKNISFDRWVKYVFDHPVKEPAWHFETDSEWWDESKIPALTVAYMTRLFEAPVETCADYSDTQIKEGLWFIADNSCSNHMYAVLDEKVSLEDRVRCIHSIFSLYEKLFEVRCTPQVWDAHEKNEKNPLNVVCYMWWDLIPICSNIDVSDCKAINEACLQVMTQTLKLKSSACLAGALHGLGHWSGFYGQTLWKRVEQIIDTFLAENPYLQPELKNYALRAKRGDIL